MLPRLQGPTHRTARALCFTGALALCPFLSASAQVSTDAATSGVTEQQLKTWHDDLKNYAPLESGCFHTAYPSVQWEKVPCGSKPAFVSAHAQAARAAAAAAAHRDNIPLETAGNGHDFVAQTAGITQSGLGTFPLVKNVTSEKGVGVAAYGGGGLLGKNEYSLQLNSDINPSSAGCSAFGYASCYVWEQFVYSTAYQSYPAQVFIQNWVFPSPTDYSNRGCPSGWNDASSSGNPACYANSAATNVPNVAATGLASLKLSGSISSGRDTAIFTYGTQAYSASESDATVHLSSWWKQSEFNVVGNAGGSEAVFNTGASITVNLAVKDGSTNAPTCLTNAGTTGESNNLNLGTCQTSAGTNPGITFTESD